MFTRVSVSILLLLGFLGLVPVAADAAPDAHLAALVASWPRPHEPADYRVPVDGAKVISPYGHRGGRAHEGIDLKAPQRTPVFSPLHGVVVQAGTMRGYGNVVVVDHGQGVRTRFAHLAGFPVRVGQFVGQGQHIGSVGSTGRATTAHLHYEVIIDGHPVNPAPYL